MIVFILTFVTGFNLTLLVLGFIVLTRMANDLRRHAQLMENGLVNIHREVEQLNSTRLP